MPPSFGGQTPAHGLRSGCGVQGPIRALQPFGVKFERSLLNFREELGADVPSAQHPRPLNPWTLTLNPR